MSTAAKCFRTYEYRGIFNHLMVQSISSFVAEFFPSTVDFFTFPSETPKNYAPDHRDFAALEGLATGASRVLPSLVKVPTWTENQRRVSKQSPLTLEAVHSYLTVLPASTYTRVTEAHASHWTCVASECPLAFATSWIPYFRHAVLCA